MLLVEEALLLFREAAQLGGALVAHAVGHAAGQGGREGIGPLRVRKNVQVADGQLVQEVVSVEKIRVGFAREAHNHVHPNAGVGHQLFDAGHPAGVERPLVAAAHEAQNFVGAALQRDVEVRHEACRSGHGFEHAIGEQVGLAAADAEAADAGHAV